MARYPDIKRATWGNPWKRTACVVTAEDGTFGVGITTHGGPVEQIINGHFAPALVGQDCMATEKVLGRHAADLGAVRQRRPGQLRHQRRRQRALGPEGEAARPPGLRAAGRPAEGEHPLLRQQHRPLVRRRARPSSGSWRSGFKAVKLFLTWGPEDGIEGIRKSEELVARTREQVGPDVELMVDAWMSLNVEYIVRLMDALRPYRVKWLEDYLLPEDTDSYIKVRQRLPGVTLASGEHWYTIHPFALAASQGLVDILQPDIAWVGGMTASVRICHIAEAHGLTVIGHAGMNYPYGPAPGAGDAGPSRWASAPRAWRRPACRWRRLIALPGTVAIKNGHVRPTDAPGFGLEITKEWLESHAV